jgi:hypothetical protein
MFPVEIFQQTLAKIVTIFTRHEIRFHLTGGLTGTAYGEPRMTQDIDLVIDPAQTALVIDRFIQSLAESDFMYEESSLRKAVQNGGMFQLLDRHETLKLDLYPRELIEGELKAKEFGNDHPLATDQRQTVV